MLALELAVNGETLATAGTDCVASVGCMISAYGDELRELKPDVGPVVVRLGGITNGHLAYWLEGIDGINCSVGDVITLRIVETSNVDVPTLRPLSPGIDNAFMPSLSIFGRISAFFARAKRVSS